MRFEGQKAETCQMIGHNLPETIKPGQATVECRRCGTQISVEQELQRVREWNDR